MKERKKFLYHVENRQP